MNGMSTIILIFIGVIIGIIIGVAGLSVISYMLGNEAK
jgi:hypothetical protein